MQPHQIWGLVRHPTKTPARVRRRLQRQPIDPVDICGSINPRPLLTEDWTTVKTSIGQRRIEEILDSRPWLLGRSVLHVGVGNSEFALHFADKVEHIDGLTVVDAERSFASSLELSNYEVHLQNKYSPTLPLSLGRTYDLIVDNNLASYACCTHHLYRMLDHYACMLNPGGRIITEKEGLGWRCDQREGWKMGYEQLAALAERFELAPSRLNPDVYQLANGLPRVS